ncbi:Hypothetical protein A7982_00095 [Minicystis rosea]|nr:Hypothetical protein A7982_00095 [Minicystis rosea]
MSTPEVVYLHLDTHGVTAELFLNGFPLVRSTWLPEGNAELCAHPFLVPGENEIVLRIEPGSRPALAATESRVLAREGASAVAQLVRYPVGTDVLPENGTVLGKIAWTASSAGSEVFPIEQRGQVYVGAAYGRWSWQDAPVLTLDESLLAEARAVIEAYGHALCYGTTAELASLMRISLADQARAFPDWPVDEQDKMLDRLVAYYHKAPEPRFSLDPERHDFRLVASGRVLQCVDDDFKGSLRLRDPDGGRDVRMPICLARIDGVLRPVR